MSTVISIEGRHKSGVVTVPHEYTRYSGTGKYVVSKTKYKKDYIFCDSLDEVAAYSECGYKVRMSNPAKGINSPSGIVRKSLNIKVKSGTEIPTIDRLLPSIIKSVDNLDPAVTAKRRKEQEALRAFLVGNSDKAKCTLCLRDYPVSMLVAAHIKRRSECTDAEKLDFKNVATLMCKFGCDSLFEQGYISVQAGKVCDLGRLDATPHIKKYIADLAGNAVSNWKGSQKYYEWHKSETNK